MTLEVGEQQPAAGPNLPYQAKNVRSVHEGRIRVITDRITLEGNQLFVVRKLLTEIFAKPGRGLA